ncbi:hypothetical protein BKA69DRAFT_1064268 [Paraphysoderma sedebokerense]|nr:hypothetical protein BKA69DRAFT_1064268 [Paraphysoderma sedebokerense]
MWAWSLTSTHTFPLNYYFVFLLLSLIGIIQFIQAFTIPTGLDEPPECANNGKRRMVASHC